MAKTLYEKTAKKHIRGIKSRYFYSVFNSLLASNTKFDIMVLIVIKYHSQYYFINLGQQISVLMNASHQKEILVHSLKLDTKNRH